MCSFKSNFDAFTWANYSDLWAISKKQKQNELFLTTTLNNRNWLFATFDKVKIGKGSSKLLKMYGDLANLGDRAESYSQW